MAINIPGRSKQYSQTNQSDNLGILYATKSCDFDSNKGAIQLGRRMILNSSTTDLANMQSYPVAFKVFDNGSDGAKIYAVAGKGDGSGNGSLYKGGFSPDTAFTEVTGLNSPSTTDSWTSDMELFNSELWVSGNGQNLFYLNSSNTWATVSSTSTQNGYARPLLRFGDRIYTVIDGYKIVSSDSSHDFSTATGKININTFGSTSAVNEVITFLKRGTGVIWIGTTSLTGQRGRVLSWNGNSSGALTEYILESTGALSCVIKDDVPWIIDSNGKLLVWNSSTFIEKASFFKKRNKQFFSPSFVMNRRFIHPNGMAIIDGDIHVLVDLMNNDVANHLGSQEECNPSGIYVYDTATGSLRHKYAFGLSKAADSIKDFGAFAISRAGALAEIPSTKDYPTNTGNGTFVAGCSFYSNATTALGGIFYDDTNDTLIKSGYFITSVINAGASKESIQDAFGKAFAFHSKYLNAADKMVIRYRTADFVPSFLTITWIDSTTFTTTSGASGYSIGDEVEIINGTGAGMCSNITDIFTSDVGYMVRVDETHTNATGTAIAKFSKWKYAGTIQDSEDLDEVPIETVSSWIQIKVFMYWTGQNEFTHLGVTNQASRLME